MLVLALDTTTRQGSVALARDGALVARLRGRRGDHTRRAVAGDSAASARRARAPRRRCRSVCRGVGPRLVHRTAHRHRDDAGLRACERQAARRHLRARCDHDARQLSALSSLSPGQRSARAWMDAQRGQVFSAVYKNGDVVESPRSSTSRPKSSRAGRATGGSRACLRAMVRSPIAI